MAKSVKPKLTIILTSHRKPIYLKEAIESVLNQTSKDYILLIVDSGDWKAKEDEVGLKMKEVFEWIVGLSNPNIQISFTTETKELRQKICINSWVMNTIVKDKLVKTLYFSQLCDDDLIYPEYIEKMVGLLEEGNHNAVYCSEKRTRIKKDGSIVDTGYIYARDIKKGKTFDCVIDYLQVMFKTELLNMMSYPWWSEDRKDIAHADGIFLNRIGELTDVYPIEDILCENRGTPLSLNNPSKE